MKLLIALCVVALAAHAQARVTATQAPVSTHITSLTDKDARSKAKVHPAFANAGQRAGVEVWRIENFDPVPVAQNDYGKFYKGDSYIVLKTTADKRNNLAHDIHYWIGSQSTQDESGAAAILTVGLDDKFNGAAIQHREAMGYESAQFLGYFQPAIRYVDGGVASGFNHVVTNPGAEKRLFQVKGKRNVRVRQILCTLSFLASGSYQKIIKENVRTYLSQPSASRCINEVVEALNNPDIVKKYIRFPQNSQERQILKERFYRKFSIPGVIGCIDGTLVALKKPAENEERFYCRKGYHARNVQLITDADLNILNVDPSYGGATHDSFIFNHSVIKDHLEALTNSGEQVVLLGDSGYAQRAYLMTPVNGAEDNSPEALYNDLHSTARNSVERTIGLLKGRFRCLLVHRVLNYHPDIVGKIVIACCVLHNLCNRAGMPAYVITEDERQEEVQLIASIQRRQTRDLPTNTDLAMGQLSRHNLINMLWRSHRTN